MCRQQFVFPLTQTRMHSINFFILKFAHIQFARNQFFFIWFCFWLLGNEECKTFNAGSLLIIWLKKQIIIINVMLTLSYSWIVSTNHRWVLQIFFDKVQTIQNKKVCFFFVSFWIVLHFFFRLSDCHAIYYLQLLQCDPKFGRSKKRKCHLCRLFILNFVWSICRQHFVETILIDVNAKQWVI